MNIENFRPLIDGYKIYYPEGIEPRKDYYRDQLSYKYIAGLSEEAFIDFFYKFHYDGGKIQGGGHRQADRFKKMLVENYSDARKFLLEPFEEDFDVVSWLNNRTSFKPMGEGFVTTYLLRIDPNRFTVVNQKSVDALKQLGFHIRGSKTGDKYQRIIDAQDKLMDTYPELTDYFMVDGLNHFIIAEEVGKKIIEELKGKENFNKRLIKAYMEYMQKHRLSDEIYKWEAIKHFQNTWNAEAENFGAMFENAISHQINLMNFRAYSVIKHFCRNNPEELREMVLILYDEDYGIEERIKQFQKSAKELIAKTKPEWKDSQDERAISVYLTFRYPEKYIHYKNSFYQKLANSMDEKVAKPGKKFIHFQEMAAHFKDDILLVNDDLLSLYREVLPANVYQDEQYNLLTQDVLYFMENRFEEVVNYWIFQCNPAIYNIENALQDYESISWSIKAHKNEIMEGDKVILWVTGQESGCYALAKVDSEVYYDKDTDQRYYYEPHQAEELDRVDLLIEHNLWEAPIPKELLLVQPAFEKFKAGNRGTNFKATKQEYDTILGLIIKEEYMDRKYWLYAPGEKARFWDEFYEKGIMAIGWDELGDLKKYSSQDEIETRLRELSGVENRKYNDARACFEFLNAINTGDVIIPKKGNSHYLGYGIVTSDFYFDPERSTYHQVRNVDWKKKGEWEETNGPIVQKTLTDITKYPDYVNELIKLIGIEEGSVVSEPIAKYGVPIDKRAKNLILYGPPGTGKTYESIDLSVELVDGKASDDHKSNKLRFDELRTEGQIEFITFHQNYAYEDFVVGLRPDPDSEVLHFRPHKGIFYKICQLARENYLAYKQGKGKAISFEEALDEVLQPIQDDDEVEVKMPSGKKFWLYDTTERTMFFRKANGSTKHSLSINTLKELENGSREMYSGLKIYYQPLIDLVRQKRNKPGTTTEYKKYVLIIDEINRANISRVFGELITLLEEDKRLDGENELKVSLPNGEKNFTIPPNLFLVGTMNTADKSIALLDIALRRRFEFIGKYPKYNKLTPFVSEKLRKLNHAIKDAKKSPDFMIGHAYFINKEDTDFKQIMNYKVIPLLYEYFNGRETFVKEILDKAELEVEQNQFSYNWEVK